MHESLENHTFSVLQEPPCKGDQILLNFEFCFQKFWLVFLPSGNVKEHISMNLAYICYSYECILHIIGFNN